MWRLNISVPIFSLKIVMDRKCQSPLLLWSQVINFSTGRVVNKTLLESEVTARTMITLANLSLLVIRRYIHFLSNILMHLYLKFVVLISGFCLLCEHIFTYRLIVPLSSPSEQQKQISNNNNPVPYFLSPSPQPCAARLFTRWQHLLFEVKILVP